MEHISVSEIPLPGEDNNCKSDDVNVQPVGNSSTEVREFKSETNESTQNEVIKSDTIIETDLQSFESNEIETTDDFKENKTELIEIQIVEPDNHNNSHEINEIVVHTENITSELLQDVVNSETIEEVTSEIITETIDIQMEVDQNVEESILEVSQEHKLELETISRDDTMESLKYDLDSSNNETIVSHLVETTNIEKNLSETSEIVAEKPEVFKSEKEVNLEQTEVEHSDNETYAPDENSEISIEETIKLESKSVKVMAKKISRTNSTIEAIKNDWSDSLTIEENSEEVCENIPEEVTENIAEEFSEKITEEVSKKITEEASDKITEDISEKIIEITEEVSEKVIEVAEDNSEKIIEEVSKKDTEEVPDKITIVTKKNTEAASEVISEEVSQNVESVINNSENENVSETTEVIVFKTGNISKNIENITIEIIDEEKNEEKLITIEEDSKVEQNVIEIDKTKEDTIEVDQSNQGIIEIDKIQEIVTEKNDKTEKILTTELESCKIVENFKESSSAESETVYIIQEVANNNKPDSSSSQSNKRVMKKEKTEKLQLPCHILGRNVDNPTEDLISNGRTPPKPRLGVKVPYRFLTSQIVSKQDIANELIEITSKRNPAPDPPVGGDIFFASKLTQRLASKIAQGSSRRNMKSEESSSGIPVEALTNPSKDSSPNTGLKSSKNPIGDKSDLLAILEGDVEVDWTKEVRNSKQTDEKSTEKSEVSIVPQKLQNIHKKMNPYWEKEMALKQLRELPKLEGRGRPRKNAYVDRTIKESLKSVPKVAPQPVKDKKVEAAPKIVPKLITNKETTENLKQAVTKISKKIVQLKDDKIVLPANKPEKTSDKRHPKANEDKGNDAIEPVLTPIRVTKTYSRKEALLNVPAELEYIVNEFEPSSALAENSDKNKEESIRNEDKSTRDKEESNKSENTDKISKHTENSENAQLIKKTKRSSMEINKPEVTLVSKRARIIKRKVIWDPAEIPKTRVLNAIRRAQAQELKSIKNQSKELKTVKQLKNEQSEINPRQLRKRKILPTKKFLMKRQLRSLNKKLIRSSNRDLKSSLVLTKKKKQVIAEIAKKVKPKKTELDKLLGDEGAVNMLYSVRQNKTIGKPIKSVSSRKELQNRTKVVKDVITQNLEDTPKTLRKKENQVSPIPIQISTPPRKKSRDSVRSSLQSPPPSPSYMYPQRADASRIIRRHSSSFSSECSSPRRLSVDQQQADKPETVEDSSKTKENDFQSPVRILRRKGVPIFERKMEEKTYKGKKKILTDAEPETEVIMEKTVPKSEKLSQAEKRKLNSEMSKNFSKSPSKKRSKKEEGFEEVKSEIKIVKPTGKNIYKEINLKKNNSLVQILLTPSSSKLKNCISLQMFRELCDVLAHLASDENCRALLITSTDSSFCHGVDFSTLIQPSAEKRLSAAQELANALKDFISTLAQFPKPLIAGIQGSAVGLGVTMLPLFDLVFASDKATFSTPYGRLGQVPEGAAFLTLPNLLGNTLTSELVFANRKLTASEALHHGLVTRVLWPDKFKDELVSSSLSVAGQSLQCMMATKSLLRQSLLSKLDEALTTENKLLVEHWTSAECQQNFKKLLQEEEWW